MQKARHKLEEVIKHSKGHGTPGIEDVIVKHENDSKQLKTRIKVAIPSRRRQTDSSSRDLLTTTPIAFRTNQGQSEAQAEQASKEMPHR